MARADRLAGLEIGIDDAAEDLARPPVEGLQTPNRAIRPAGQRDGTAFRFIIAPRYVAH